ncbi:MAG TPA: glycine cleavage system aminomethyltransferase GcvT [Pirellula sp.]|nr:glycine cleavage system aminomethyltransferase GcvT [Pirellula sp.]
MHAWHHAHGARMAEFANYEMPIQYTGIVSEHLATRTAAGVFDISHMGRLRFDGPRADQLLDHLLTRCVLDMQIGQVRYSLVCNEEGGILDDVLVSCLESPSGKNYFLLVVNASNREKIVRWLKPHLADFPDVEYHDVTEATGMIAVQGPRATEICKQLLPASVLSLGYYRAKVMNQMGKPCIVSRTGYTGEDGFELIVKAEDAVRVWENIMLAGRDWGVQACGLGARDTLRLEAGMPLYGHELDESIDPYQAGLGFACNLKDRIFVGRESLEQKSKLVSLPKRVGLLLDGRRAARQGARVFDADSRVIGQVTSGSFSPTLDRPIAMAYLDTAVVKIGSSFDIDIRGTRVSATIVPLPFYKKSSSL